MPYKVDDLLATVKGGGGLSTCKFMACILTDWWSKQSRFKYLM